jgi:hypothetical protein
MTRRGTEIEINDFRGGLRTTSAITELNFNESPDLSNVVIGPKGSFVRSRYGNSKFNASEMNSGANVQSLSYYKLINGNEFLVSIAGNAIFKSDDLDGTMDDITGGLTITAGADNIWTFITFNNVHIGFGGPATAPNAPIQWTGTGNAAALSGTPPSAYGCIQANNRVFAFRTAANPSIVQWSVLGDPQDWTGTGSGSQNVSTADNDFITAMAVLNESTVLVFKQNSTHTLLVSTLESGAFPLYSLFKGTGCVGKHAVVVADGLCYFINNQGEMRITDGVNIIEETTLPNLSNIDNLWSTINPVRYEYIQGIHVRAEDYNHIVWVVTSGASGTTNDMAYVWDIYNKCWIRHKTGYAFNVITQTQAGILYAGDYAGFIYKLDDNSLNTDASNGGVNIDSYWRSGWESFGSYEKHKPINEAYISFVSQNSGDLQFSWGYNFNVDQRTESIDQKVSGGIIGVFIIGEGLIGGQTDFIKRIMPIGNGNVFQYQLRNINSRMKVNSLNLIGERFAFRA